MKNSSLYIPVLLFVVVLFYSCVKNNAKIGVSNKVENNIYIDTPVDWGQSLTGDTIKILTVCHNSSNKDVYINYIETPCGCTTVIPRSDVIKKNDSVLIDIIYKPSYADLGYTEKNIFVYLKYKNEPLHFLIKGRVKRKNDKID